TDPVITFSDNSIDVTTGTLKQGGTAVSLSTHNHDATYVNATGDTMTGTLTFNAATDITTVTDLDL
ncbi:MAG TPA: hypothetical protein DDX89_05185, partial [Candidatus Omnitrophica bacterium]|nr:hypothetical protein [Candidatus Omnitrophota bacterium]